MKLNPDEESILDLALFQIKAKPFQKILARRIAHVSGLKYALETIRAWRR